MMEQIVEEARRLAEQAGEIARNTEVLAAQIGALRAVMATPSQHVGGVFLGLFTVFVLAIFVGYYVVWRVTPALHSPLMAVTNAISSAIIVGAILAAGPAVLVAAKAFGLFAVILASVNIFGGFIVTQRMLAMFKKKSK